jgi:hypothetical protein
MEDRTARRITGFLGSLLAVFLLPDRVETLATAEVGARAKPAKVYRFNQWI